MNIRAARIDDAHDLAALLNLAGERLPEYQAIAGPLAAKSGGYVPLAFSDPVMLEGEAPSPGLFVGSRRVELHVPCFDRAQELEACVRPLRAGPTPGMHAFEGELRAPGDERALVAATLSVALLDALPGARASV